MGVELTRGNLDLSNHKECAKAVSKRERSGEWREIDLPVSGDVVAMAKGRFLHHVGIYIEIDSGICIHAVDGSRVVAHSIQQLKTIGFNQVRFFSHVSRL